MTRRCRPSYPTVFFDDVVDRFQLDGTGRLLDLGCGTGQVAIPLAPHVAEAVGMDLDPEMLPEAASQAPARRADQPDLDTGQVRRPSG